MSISTSGSGGGGEGGGGDGGGGATTVSIIIPDVPNLSVDCNKPVTDRLATVIAAASIATTSIFEVWGATLIREDNYILLIMDYAHGLHSSLMEFSYVLFIRSRMPVFMGFNLLTLVNNWLRLPLSKMYSPIEFFIAPRAYILYNICE